MGNCSQSNSDPFTSNLNLGLSYSSQITVKIIQRTYLGKASGSTKVTFKLLPPINLDTKVIGVKGRNVKIS